MEIIHNDRAQKPTQEQKQFLDELAKFPRIARHWNQVSLELDIDGLEKDLRVMSSGECATARFLGDLWLRESRFGFNLIDDISDMDEQGRALVTRWSAEPFYP